MRGISLLSKGKNTCIALKRQLHNFLGRQIRIRGYYIDGIIEKPIRDDIVLISSSIIYEQAIEYVDKDSLVIVAHRSVNYHQINKLLDIPKGTDVLLVNDLKPTTEETVAELRALGIDHINFYPYYPGMTDFKALDTAVTPGELELVPAGVKKVIDIGSRNIDFTTMVEIFKAMEICDGRLKLLSARYIKDIIDLIKKAQDMAEKNSQIKNQLQTIINTVHDGIIALDKKRTVTVFNPIAEEIFAFPKEKILGKNLDESLRNHIPITLNSDISEHESFVKVKDKYIVLNKASIVEENHVVGSVYTLKDVTEIQRLEEELRRKLLSEQKIARYTIDDIAGFSSTIKNTKELARKLAKSNSNILIQGESGTGKELFAQAIHNMSHRKNGPFVAVNFAALPESLLESELFGYEEGAFTGAKKGGKIGLFEQAHGGTVFLDEIGDAPVYFQIRLLRVIQEKQVQRIGGSKIIPIDIRVISATNRDLKELVKKQLFRKDLYYRLNVLPLKIPPLRSRSDDIMTLTHIFYEEYLSDPPLKPEDYFKHVKNHFINYDWPGNIRELSNIVEYLVSICPHRAPLPKMLPEEMRIDEKITDTKDNFIPPRDNHDFKLILKLINQSNEMERPIGRRSLSRATGISESRIRKTIDILRERELVQVQKGIKGLKITEKGKEVLQ